MHFDSATNDPVADIIYKFLCDHLCDCYHGGTEGMEYTEELGLFSVISMLLWLIVTAEPRRARSTQRS